jgi:hypothetical protein
LKVYILVINCQFQSAPPNTWDKGVVLPAAGDGKITVEFRPMSMRIGL